MWSYLNRALTLSQTCFSSWNCLSGFALGITFFPLVFIQQSLWVPAIWSSTILGLVSSNWGWIFKSPSSWISFIQVALCVPPPLELRWGKQEQNWNAVCSTLCSLGLSLRLQADFTINLITWGEKAWATDFSRTILHCLTQKIHVWCFSF